MDITNNNINGSTDIKKQSDKLINMDSKPKANEESIKVKPKRVRKQATPEQLSNPFHGVKLVQILERLVAFYGWVYLGKRTNIRCFMYNPNMKSCLGFLRKTTWAREFVEDVYLEMLDEKEEKETIK